MTAAPFSFHCTICFDTFHPDLRYPVVLPCGHTFICNICAKRLDKCMECRTSLFFTPPPPVVEPKEPRNQHQNIPPADARSRVNDETPQNTSRISGGTLGGWRRGRVHPSALGGSSRSSSGRSNRSTSRSQLGQRQQQSQQEPQKPQKPQEPVPLPLPKNVILLSLMEAAAHEARARKEMEVKETALKVVEIEGDMPREDADQHEGVFSCENAETEVLPHSVSFSSASTGAKDKDIEGKNQESDDYTWCEGADEDDLVKLGIQIVNSTCGTYAVANPDGLVLYREVCTQKTQELTAENLVNPSRRSSNFSCGSEDRPTLVLPKDEDSIKEQNILGISTKENQVGNSVCSEEAVLGQSLSKRDGDRDFISASSDEDCDEDDDNLEVLLNFHRSIDHDVIPRSLPNSLIWRVSRNGGPNFGPGITSMTRIGSLMDTDGDFSDVDKDELGDVTPTDSDLQIDGIERVPIAGEVIGFGSKVQVVFVGEDGWVKLARNKGFLRIAPDSLQLVKVGIAKDKACQMEGMLHLLNERTKELESSQEKLRRMEEKLEGVLQKALDDDEGVSVIEMAKRVDITETDSSVENCATIAVDSRIRASSGDMQPAFVRASSSRDVAMLSTNLRSVLATGRRSPGALPLRPIVTSNSFDTGLASSQTGTMRKKIDFRTGLSGHQALLSPTAHIPQNVRRNVVRMMSHHKGIGFGAPASAQMQKESSGSSGAFLNCSQPELRSVQDSNIACGLQQRLSKFQ